MKTRTRIPQLRIKIKSLADEARIIRHEEDRALGRKAIRRVRGPVPNKKLRFEWGRTGRKPDLVLYCDLRAHRRDVVRKVARTALLALAMIRGMPYARVERDALAAPDWAEVRKVAERFGAVRDYEAEPFYDKVGEAAWAARKSEQAARFDAWLMNAKGEESSPAVLTPRELTATVQA